MALEKSLMGWMPPGDCKAGGGPNSGCRRCDVSAAAAPEMRIQMQHEPNKLIDHRQENPSLPRDVKVSLLIATCHPAALRHTNPIQSFVYPRVSYSCAFEESGNEQQRDLFMVVLPWGYGCCIFGPPVRVSPFHIL